MLLLLCTLQGGMLLGREKAIGTRSPYGQFTFKSNPLNVKPLKTSSCDIQSLSKSKELQHRLEPITIHEP